MLCLCCCNVWVFRIAAGCLLVAVDLGSLPDVEEISSVTLQSLTYIVS